MQASNLFNYKVWKQDYRLEYVGLKSNGKCISLIIEVFFQRKAKG